MALRESLEELFANDEFRFQLARTVICLHAILCLRILD